MLTFITPAGIGDISWVVSKIHHLFDKREVALKICDWVPPRSKEFVDLLPVKNLGYTKWNYPDGALPITTDLDSLEDGEYRIQCNLPLEKGIRLADIFPLQPTAYHYPLNIDPKYKRQASAFLGTSKDTIRIGIYASGHRGHCPWSISHWVEFCGLLRKQFPNATFYCIGAPWDDRTSNVYMELYKQRFNVVSAVGEHHIGTTIEVIKGLDYFFAYPSGLGILADVVQTPCMMWIYKEFPQGLINSYQDPNSTAKHLNVPTQTVKESFESFTKHFLDA